MGKEKRRIGKALSHAPKKVVRRDVSSAKANVGLAEAPSPSCRSHREELRSFIIPLQSLPVSRKGCVNAIEATASGRVGRQRDKKKKESSKSAPSRFASSGAVGRRVADRRTVTLPRIRREMELLFLMKGKLMDVQDYHIGRVSGRQSHHSDLAPPHKKARLTDEGGKGLDRFESGDSGDARRKPAGLMFWPLSYLCQTSVSSMSRGNVVNASRPSQRSGATSERRRVRNWARRQRRVWVAQAAAAASSHGAVSGRNDNRRPLDEPPRHGLFGRQHGEPTLHQSVAASMKNAIDELRKSMKCCMHQLQ